MKIIMKKSQRFSLNHNFDTTTKNGTLNPAFEPDVPDLNRLENGTVSCDYPTEKRATWGNSLEFLMSCISMSVGLGNLWRFPFVAYKNGGGAFLIPYFITLFIIGRPLYYMDMFLGQFSGKGNFHMFRSLSPGFKGVAYGQLFAVSNVSTYYCSVMALTLIYFIKSCSEVLPWSICQPEWENCVSSNSFSNDSFKNKSSSSELFFRETILHEKSNIDDGIGTPDFQLTMYLLIAWIFIFFVVIKGVKSSGKISYFLALFPYVIMITLLIRGITLDGSFKGIKFFVTPDWGKLLDADVWYAAITQCFFSLNVAVGPVVMFSSYNDFRHNINRDSIIVAIMDTCTSFLAGCTIFAILGNLSYHMNTSIDEVVRSGGPGIAFISYPNAISNFQFVPQLFAAMFFIMLFILGIGSLVSMQGCIATMLKDEHPFLKDWWIAAGTCSIGFIIGLVYVTPGGQFILTLVDHFAVTFIIYIMAVTQAIVVTWFYGLEDVCLDLEFMLRKKVNIYWRICWAIITPVLLLIVLVYSLEGMKTLKYGQVSYPHHVIAIGWCLFAFGILQIPIWALWVIFKKRHLGFPQAIAATFSFENWGPKDLNLRKEWQEFKEHAKAERKSKGSSKFVYLFNTLIGRD